VAADTSMPDRSMPDHSMPDNSSAALHHLRGLIAEAGPGHRLPAERELCERLGIGRRAVRRALEVLEAEGLLWRRQGKGTFVGAAPARTLAGRTNPLEVHEARMALEPVLARLAALRATGDEVARMRELVARIAQAEDDDARELWDEALHRTIGRAAGNALLLETLTAIASFRRDEGWRSLRERARSHRTDQQYAAQHAAIVDAIAARDPEAAEAAMRAHIRALAENILPASALELARAG
jgi:DNA-binding FadR family transcriptional regulator